MPEALDELSRDGFTTSEYDFRDEPKEEWIHRFDGYFANAVLLHASPDVFIQALATIPKILKRGGFAAFSVKAGDGEEESMEKMDAPRYFNYHTEPELRELLSNLPVEIVSITHPDNGKWLHLVIKSVE
jgi:SAM-dependent methyltransferase